MIMRSHRFHVVATEPISPITATGYLLLKAGHYMGIEFEGALDALGMSGREFLVLSFAVSAEGLSQQDVSERLGVDPTIVVGLVDAVEERGWLTRKRDPDDRRRNLLVVTPAGRKTYAKAVQAAAAAEDRFLQPLPAAEREQLRELLHALMRSRLPWLD